MKLTSSLVIVLGSSLILIHSCNWRILSRKDGRKKEISETVENPLEAQPQDRDPDGPGEPPVIASDSTMKESGEDGPLPGFLNQVVPYKGPVLRRFPFHPLVSDTLEAGQLHSTATRALQSKSSPQGEGRRSDGDSESDFHTTVRYKARDSIIFDMRDKTIRMYEQTRLDYGGTKLSAARTDVDLDALQVKSSFRLDSLGEKKGKPVFTEDGKVYETDKIDYNFKTRRARIQGVVTEDEGAFMHGDDVRKTEDGTMYIDNVRYTTCNIEDPHFFIESKKFIIIPKKMIVTGPFNLRFRNLLTPLWFPFGMLPNPDERTSGIIFPNYGEERRRGFFLKNGGYYFAIRDYIDLKILGSIYSKGGTSLSFNSNYRKRYRYSGSFNFSFNQNISDEIESPLKTNDYWVRWNFSPESRGPRGRFSVSASFGTSTYNSNNNLVNQDFNRSIKSQYSSNFSYSKQFHGTPFNMNMSARINQNIQTKIVTVSFPEMTVNMRRIYPLRRLAKGNSSWLNKLNFSHNMVLKNQITNRPPPSSQSGSSEVPTPDPLPFLDNLSILQRRAKSGIRHQIPVSTSIPALGFLVLTPNLRYEEIWYDKSLRYEYLESEGKMKVDTIPGFNRVSSWRTGVSANTVLYGQLFFQSKVVKALRHTLTPSVSYSYTPDFSDPSRGIYQQVQTDQDGTMRRISKYQGFAFGSPSGQEAQSIGISLQNSLEMKVRHAEDTTGVGTRKISLLKNLSMSTSYNMVADSFKLSNISFSTRYSFLKNALGLNIRGTIDPYIYHLISEADDQGRGFSQRRLDRYAWNNGQGLGQLSAFNMALTLSLKPKSSKDQKGKKTQGESSAPQSGTDQQEDLSPVDQQELDNYLKKPPAIHRLQNSVVPEFILFLQQKQKRVQGGRSASDFEFQRRAQPHPQDQDYL